MSTTFSTPYRRILVAVDGSEPSLWAAQLASRLRGGFIEDLEDASHSWFKEFIGSISSPNHPDELHVYHGVARSIRRLAEAGRSVIVGRGGVFITEGLPGGLHIRLVAPLRFRILQMAQRLGGSIREAAEIVDETDRNRCAFYHRYWPKKTVDSDTFTVTLNTAELSEQQMVGCLLPLVCPRHTNNV